MPEPRRSGTPGGGGNVVQVGCGASAVERGTVEVVPELSQVALTPTAADHDEQVVRFTAWVDGVATTWSEAIGPSIASEVRAVFHPLRVVAPTPATLSVRVAAYRRGVPVAMAASNSTVVELQVDGRIASMIDAPPEEHVVDGQVVYAVTAGLAGQVVAGRVPVEEVGDVE